MGQLMADFLWKGRQFWITVSSTTGSIQVSMSASKSPLNPQQFDEFLTHLDALMDGLNLVWRRSEVEVPLDNLELNLDYRSLFIGAQNRVKLKKFRNSWAQVYQKGERLRAEIRMHPLEDEELRWSELSSILSTITTPLRQEVDKSEPEPKGYAPKTEPWDGEVA